MRHFTQQIITRIGQFLDQDLSGSALDLADPPDSSLGDLALACFPISKMLKKSPVEVANDLASRDWDLDWLDGVTATGPYLNFRVRRDLFSSEVLKLFLCKRDVLLLDISLSWGRLSLSLAPWGRLRNGWT